MSSILCARLTCREPSSLSKKEGIKSIGRISTSMDGDIYISKIMETLDVAFDEEKADGC